MKQYEKGKELYLKVELKHCDEEGDCAVLYKDWSGINSRAAVNSDQLIDPDTLKATDAEVEKLISEAIAILQRPRAEAGETFEAGEEVEIFDGEWKRVKYCGSFYTWESLDIPESNHGKVVRPLIRKVKPTPTESDLTEQVSKVLPEKRAEAMEALRRLSK